MFETLGLDGTTPRAASVWLGLLIGLAFGILAERTRFCFRRAMVGPMAERAPALGLWLTALAFAIAGTQIAAGLGWITFGGHRFLAADLPVLSIAMGGLLFGAGMVLTRGCASRLAVLAGSGNLRAALVLLAFAVVAHATMRGTLAPVRAVLGGVALPVGDHATLAAIPGGAVVWAGLLVALCLLAAWRAGLAPASLAAGAAIGLLVPAAWVGTGWILLDDFDPIPMEAISFTQPTADTLFWLIASSAVPGSFSTGLVGGVVFGALVSSLAGRRFGWQSFATPRETGRYMAGAAMMGVGGVLAGGCTLGAGLSGIPTLSVAALLALGAIALGAKLMDRAVSPSTAGSAAPPTRRPA